MNILLVHQNFLEAHDGGGSRFNEMTRFWEEQGHHVTVLAGTVNHATGEIPERYRGKYTFTDVISENRTVIRCHISSGYAKSFFGRLMGYFSFVFSSIYAGFFKLPKRKYDVILSTSPPLFVGITAYVLGLFKRIPIVFEVRDLWPESAIDTGVLNNKTAIRMAYWFEGFIYRKAKLINALTPAFEAKMLNQKGVPREKVIMIPNAADFSLSDQTVATVNREEMRKELGIDGKVAIIYVGAHGVANHLIQVIETAELLKEEEEVVFMLVGDGMQKQMLVDEAEKRGLKNVKFWGIVPKSEVFKYIYAADFGASVLKKVDTFKTIYSNKTFDYMSCKRPILMVIDGVSRELVEKAECGTYIEPENPEVFAQTIRDYLAMDRSEWAKQGESGFTFAKANFDRNVLATRYLENLERIAKAGV